MIMNYEDDETTDVTTARLRLKEGILYLSIGRKRVIFLPCYACRNSRKPRGRLVINFHIDRVHVFLGLSQDYYRQK